MRKTVFIPEVDNKRSSLSPEVDNKNPSPVNRKKSYSQTIKKPNPITEEDNKSPIPVNT